MPSADVDIEAPPPKEDTPLISQDGVEIDPSKLLQPVKEGNIHEIIVGAFGVVTFAASATAMLIGNGIFIIISGLFGVAMPPYAAFQQMKITQTVAMEETNKFFDKQLDTLRANNDRLSANVKEMTGSVSRLKDLENTLESVQSMSGNCLQKLEGQLKTQQEIAAKLETNVRDELVANLLEIAMNCDADGNMELSDEEVEDLIQKIESINGVDVREEKMRQMVKDHGRGIMSLLDVAKGALRDDIPEEDRLFVYLDK